MGNLGQFAILVIVIVVISAIVGAIAQFLNRLGEMNGPNRRAANPAGRAAGPAPVKQVDRDMDRFLPEIDRLRKKNTEAPPPANPSAAPVVPVVRPNRPQERPRSRAIAELEAQPA